ncbi:hypothetical protein ACIQZG_20945 [Lysinibacillus sp. NPDC096418]|uniref:hypothetical protein n=1 Tax=Lysinibacillus sp. NPDC096418 TaxID=3364138 RepID=UPI00380EB57F
MFKKRILKIEQAARERMGNYKPVLILDLEQYQEIQTQIDDLKYDARGCAEIILTDGSKRLVHRTTVYIIDDIPEHEEVLYM